MLSQQSSIRPRALLALCCAAAILAIGSGLAFTSSQRMSDEAAAHRDKAATIEVDQIRLMINRSAFDDIAVRVGVMAGTLDETDLEQSTARRTAVWADASSRLASIENVGVTPQVDFLLDLLDVASPVLIGDLFAVGSQAQFDNRPDTPGRSDADVDFDFIDHAYTLVLYEALLAEVDRSGNTTDLLHPYDIEFIVDDIEFVSSNPGYLGPDADAPLNDSYVFVEGVGSDRVNPINDLIAASNIWIIEQWTRAWAEGSDQPPPVSLTDVSNEVARDAALIRGTVDARLDQALDAAAMAEAEAAGNASTARLVAIGVGLAAVGSLCACLVLAWRRARQTRTMVSTDHLTGAGNRHRLDVAARKTERAELAHHVVVVIDLDRFKLVNDTHGHAVGDKVLIELTQQLRAVLKEVHADEHELIRLGGDEFTITLHSTSAIDTDDLKARLENVRDHTVTAVNGEAVSLAFSFGYTEADGSPSLLGLLDAADLKAYEDKKRRRHSRTANNNVTSELANLER